MSIRNLIESAIKGDAVSFNETFEKVMGESVVSTIEEENNPIELEDVIETLLTLGVVTEEDFESEDFTEETILEISKKVLGSYIKSASVDKSYHAHDIGKVNGKAQTTGTDKLDRLERDASNRKHSKRSSGIQHAVDKLTGSAKINAKEDLDNDEEIVHEGKSYRRGDEKYNDIKKLKKGAATLRTDRKNKRQVEEEVTEEVIELDEVSKKLLGRYIKKAAEDKSKARHSWTNMMNSKGYSYEDRKKASDHEDKRTKGLSKAVDKLMDKKD